MAWDLGPTPTHPQIITDAGDITVSPQLSLLEPITTGWFQKDNHQFSLPAVPYHWRFVDPTILVA
jgi:hypothetical protein